MLLFVHELCWGSQCLSSFTKKKGKLPSTTKKTQLKYTLLSETGKSLKRSTRQRTAATWIFFGFPRCSLTMGCAAGYPGKASTEAMGSCPSIVQWRFADGEGVTMDGVMSVWYVELFEEL